MDGVVLLASTTEQAPTTTYLSSFYITGRTYPWDVLVNMVTNNEATIKKEMIAHTKML